MSSVNQGSETAKADAPRIMRGLKDVYFERSAVTSIDGRAGDLRYRGYSIHDLAEHSTFEEEAAPVLSVGEGVTRAQAVEADLARHDATT